MGRSEEVRNEEIRSEKRRSLKQEMGNGITNKKSASKYLSQQKEKYEQTNH